jgi:hypothetical protein
VFYGISIPAEAPWVSELQSQKGEAKAGPSGTSHNPLKRILETAAHEDAAPMDMDGDDQPRYLTIDSKS